MPLELRSPAFPPGGRIPVIYTADGENISPPLEWSDPPPGSRSFVLIVEDPDAPGGTFHHWGIYDIDADIRSLPEGVEDDDFPTVTNDFGQRGYGGPAPPKGHGTHHYHFRLGALDVDTLPAPLPTKIPDLWRAALGHMLAQAELVGTYSR
jgi:Raf kinase inhibitor-like YbhB/YbcL family protein